MHYLTDRKRVAGLGVAKSGVHHFWVMKISSVALLGLIPLFVFTFGPMLGRPYDEVIAYFSQPFPAIVAGLTILVGFRHFKDGAQVLIEDYVHGWKQRALIIATILLSYTATAVGLFAIARIAL
ncbi:succinate dehydrogenase, hydrophobic membrane anchor protein [Antarcticimicrobium sediminis]|uniref:Succinate dehydrogenase hydrophobic membrane anchor subunit n=1 Tax=Antarcticimicrobium sediminis TaxID=2546227 RepID=A0A4R5EXV4_9RHOB|nr:succinate dehydrogenase, hydrophobic membrane anchor protein [Antarcticimicrobium sediminis]TDE39627.1 succinate dehydrogenase, hydrophobic membrane anchor protein [Antarcticimicrobium sediminis]